MRDICIDRELCIFLAQMLKQSVSPLLTAQNTLFEGLAVKYIPYYYCMLVRSLI